MALFVHAIKKNSIRIITPCCIDVKNYKRTSGSSAGEYYCESALWDTGASVTLVSERVAAELGLVKTGTTLVSGFDGVRKRANTYRIDLRFSDDMRLDFVEAVETPSPFFDMLIGMDVICQGNFHLDNKSELPCVSFEL